MKAFTAIFLAMVLLVILWVTKNLGHWEREQALYAGDGLLGAEALWTEELEDDPQTLETKRHRHDLDELS